MNIFIGSSKSKQALIDLRKIATIIEDAGHTPLPWNKVGMFPPGRGIAESLREICKRVDAAILIFSEDDRIWYKNDYSLMPRDNVIYEYGLFEGHLGAGRTIVCKRGEPKMASDLQGIIYCNIEKEFRLEEELASWMHTLELLQIKSNLFT